MAGMAGLEPVTSAVTGQRSNQLSYIPTQGDVKNKKSLPQRQVLVSKLCDEVAGVKIKIRAADAKEVGVGNPAEETCCYPNTVMLHSRNPLSTGGPRPAGRRFCSLYAGFFSPKVAA
jgi:hypothetical protein